MTPTIERYQSDQASNGVNIKPLGNRILVKQATEAEVTASGIVLPDTAEKEKKPRVKSSPLAVEKRYCV